MTDKIIENNQVEIMGKIASRFTFSHQVFGEGFYMVDWTDDQGIFQFANRTCTFQNGNDK